MILLHYPPLAWYYLVYGDTDAVIERHRREREWTPNIDTAGAVGLFQQIPSTFSWADVIGEWRDSPVVRDNLASLRETFRKAGMNADQAAVSFEAMTKTAARNIARDRLRQEMHGALARGDRKTYKRKLAELRKITPERH